MQVAQFVDVVEEQGHALFRSAEQAGLAAVVPDCPRWRVRSLLRHMGKVHRWAETHLREGRAATAGGTHPPTPTAPDADALLTWCVEGHAALVATLRAAPADLDCWTFIPGSTPLEFWARRQAHETAIHRADADRARGVVTTFDPELAADGIDEVVAGLFGRPGTGLVADPPVSFVVRPTDVDRSWRMDIGRAGRQVASPAPDLVADCTVAGTSSNLYLQLWNRTAGSAPRVDGDPTVLDLWRDKAQIG